LVKLRNPWGSKEWALVLTAIPIPNLTSTLIFNWEPKEWHGDWSDTSGRWTKAMRKAVGYNPDIDDGEFYMSLQDIRKV